LDRFRTLRFSPDGRDLLVVASTGDCLVWDRTNGYLASLPGSAERTTAAAWQPDAGWLALAENNGPIRILAPPDFLQLDEVSASGEINALAFSPDGKRMAWGGADGARVWDFETKSHITPPLAHGAPVNALSFSMRGELLATAARDAKARVFRVPNDGSEPIFPPVPHVMRETSETSHLGSDVVAPRFATDDTVLLTLDEPQGFPDRRTLVWRSALTGVPMPESPAREFVGLCSFAVSLGGKYVAALGDVKGRLWDARSQKVLSAIPGPPAFAWNEHVAFSDDGETLITCAHDTRARLYSVADD
jgi:WD40 repeat protein